VFAIRVGSTANNRYPGFVHARGPGGLLGYVPSSCFDLARNAPAAWPPGHFEAPEAAVDPDEIVFAPTHASVQIQSIYRDQPAHVSVFAPGPAPYLAPAIVEIQPVDLDVLNGRLSPPETGGISRDDVDDAIDGLGHTGHRKGIPTQLPFLPYKPKPNPKAFSNDCVLSCARKKRSGDQILRSKKSIVLMDH
jgi:hypothetical protein